MWGPSPLVDAPELVTVRLEWAVCASDEERVSAVGCHSAEAIRVSDEPDEAASDEHGKRSLRRGNDVGIRLVKELSCAATMPMPVSECVHSG
jgi:hypothetical protein